MKKILALALLANVGVAHAAYCDVDATWPSGLRQTRPGFQATGYNWISLKTPPSDLIPGEPDSCSGAVLGKPQPPPPSGLVHTTNSQEQSWGVNIAYIDPINVLQSGSEGYPFWSLQLQDTGSGVGVLTATLYPGLQVVGISLTTQQDDGEPIMQTEFLNYRTLPGCLNFGFDFAGSGQSRFLRIGCSGQIVRQFNLPQRLQPYSVSFGKLASGEGPAGRFSFELVEGTNPALPTIVVDSPMVPTDG
jgi:hypothetical protein